MSKTLLLLSPGLGIPRRLNSFFSSVDEHASNISVGVNKKEVFSLKEVQIVAVEKSILSFFESSRKVLHSCYK